MDYPVMRVQELKTEDGTDKRFLAARKEVEKELTVSILWQAVNGTTIYKSLSPSHLSE